MSRKIDIASAPEKRGSGYPAPFHETGMRKFRKKLAACDVIKLTPGSAIAQ